MRGRIIKRKGSSNYTIVLQLGLDPVSGKRKQRWIAAGTSKREAEAKLAELLHEQAQGTLTKPNKLTIGECLDQWLRDYRPRIAPNTAQSYEFFIERHIKPAIGQIPLTSLTPVHLQRLYSDKLSSGRKDGKGGLSGRSVRYIHVTLHRALKSAVRLGILSRNVADNVDVPGIECHEMRTMTEDDILTFLESAKTGPYYVLYFLALFSGLRRSELLGLRWTDIDLLGCQLSVTRTLHRLNNGEIIFKEPKTQKSRRLVALSPATVQVLRDHKASQETERLLAGKLLKEDDLVFAQPDGQPLKPDTVSHAFVALARRLGFEGISLHSCRHSHATLLLKRNTHPAVVMQRLGHSSITVTINTYSHVMPSLQKSAAKDFDSIITPERESH
jgi:integrase